MKRFISRIVFLFVLTPVFSQTTIVLQPNGIDGKDALLANCVPCGYANTNYGWSEDFAAAAWTNNGADSKLRSLIRFDLTSIPANSSIVSATLSLYHNPSSLNGDHSSLSGSNESVIQRVTTPWDENVVTWQNQPNTTTINQVILPQSTSTSQNYININVQALVQDMVNSPTTNFGFLLKMVSETAYRRMIFASSDHPNSELHPRLTIVYNRDVIRIDTCLTMQPNAEEGKDALIANCFSCGYFNTNYGASEDFAAAAWTNNGDDSKLRALIDFDWNAIPSNANLYSANLSLFHNPTSLNGQHSNLSGSNESVIQRVISSWSENTVTWGNQPSTSQVSQVTIPQSYTANQNYTGINVMPLVQDIVDNPNNSFGLLFKISSETAYRRMIFASSDHPNSQLHPKLEVCYTSTAALVDVDHGFQFTIFPNPTNGTFKVVTDSINEYRIDLFDLRGRLVFSSNFKELILVDISQFERSIYLVRLYNGQNFSTKKLVVN
jgi:hypothetical protein